MLNARMGKRSKYDQERIAIMLERGMPPREVADALGIRRDAVYYVAQKMRAPKFEPYGFTYRHMGMALRAGSTNTAR